MLPKVLQKLRVPKYLDPEPREYSTYPDIEGGFERSKLEDSPEYFDEFKSVTGLMWSAGSSFRDLQALSLAFIQGFLLYAPHSYAPLDVESSIIIEQLNIMNRLDMITETSQPYREYDRKGKLIKQRPYVDFFYPNDKATKLSEMLLERRESVVIQTVCLSTGVQMQYGSNKKLPIKSRRLPASQRLEQGEWVDDYGTSIEIESDDGMYQYFLDIFGPDFQPMIQKELTHITVIDMCFNNEVFDELVRIGKELL